MSIGFGGNADKVVKGIVTLVGAGGTAAAASGGTAAAGTAATTIATTAAGILSAPALPFILGGAAVAAVAAIAIKKSK